MPLQYPLADTPGALVSQEWRRLFDEGVFRLDVSPEAREGLIQPASLDTITGNVAYWVPHGFKPEMGLTVMDTLRLQKARYQREFPIPKEGFVAEKGFSWLIPLKGEFFLPEGYWLCSNPKSTQGRLFNHVRLIADGQSSYDKIFGPWKGNLYAVFEPLPWSMRMYEDLALNQIRIFSGFDNTVSTKEILERWDSDGLVRDFAGEKVPLPDFSFSAGGVLLTLDLAGSNYSGIVGFSSVPNPHPLDQKGKLEFKEYWSAVQGPSTGRLEIGRDEFLILTTLFQYSIPMDWCAEMTPFLAEAGDVRLHFAGFFDPGFFGTGTLEVSNRHANLASLDHRQKVGKLEFSRNRAIPDKAYGAAACRSNYQGQVGSRLAKQFGPFDAKAFAILAKELDKSREEILVVSRADLGLMPGQGFFQGFLPGGERSLDEVLDKKSFMNRRDEAESLPNLKQPIPYCILIDPSDGSFFAYQRSKDDQSIHERRLQGKWSVGVGGHVRAKDGHRGLESIMKGLEREVKREELSGADDLDFKFVGYLNDDRDAVGSVHFGLVYVGYVTPEQKRAIKPKSSEIRQGRFYTREELAAQVRDDNGVIEGWTQILLEAMEKGQLKQ